MITEHKPIASHSNQVPVIDYQKIVEAVPLCYVAFYTDDPLFTVAAESPKHAAVALVNRDETIGKPVFDVWPDTSEKYKKTGVSDLLESFRTVIKSKQPDSMPNLHYNIPGPNGTMISKVWQITHYPVIDDAGTVTMVYQDNRDITEEIAASQALQRTQRTLDEALAAGMIGTYTWDIATGKVVGGKNMAAMYGLTPEVAAAGVSRESLRTSMHPDDRTAIEKAMSQALKSADTLRTEYRTISHDGSIRWLNAHSRIERNAAGKATSLSGVLVDITERKLIENNLSYLAKASVVLSASLDYKQTLQTIAKLMVPDIADWCGIEILGEDGQLQQVAVAHKDPKKVKWAVELRRKQGPPNLDDPGGVPNVMRSGKAEFYPVITDEMIEASNPTPDEIELLRELALTSIIIVPLKIRAKTVGAISLITTDQKRIYTQSDLEMAEELASRASLAMTNASLYDTAQKDLKARIRLEEELRLANEELEDRVETRTVELETSNQSLQRSNQELQDFAYVASHDLQEPLRKIQAFGNLLETEYADSLGEGKDYLKRMRNAAARMSNLIEDILSFSRVSTKGREFNSVNLRRITEEVVSDLEIRIADTEAHVEIGDLPTIHADAMQMRQLLQNLIANAIKFHRPDAAPIIQINASLVTAGLQNNDIKNSKQSQKQSKIKYCRLEITDNGLGFDEKYLDRIFAVFQRLHNRDSFEGTGIGLAVCRKIVDRHGGTITAQSKPGTGSTFIITLPMRHKKGDSLL